MKIKLDGNGSFLRSDELRYLFLDKIKYDLWFVTDTKKTPSALFEFEA